MAPSDGDRELEGLSDRELRDRESTDRVEYFRLGRLEPPSNGTTYRSIRASRALLEAWRRWSQSSVAVRLRGLVRRKSDEG